MLDGLDCSKPVGRQVVESLRHRACTNLAHHIQTTQDLTLDMYVSLETPNTTFTHC
jgi:hypothetical protein